MRRRVRTLLTLGALLFLLPGAVQSGHEVNHRYTIKGYILDEREQPMAEVLVSVRLGGQPLGGVRTELDGYYSVQVHVHDADIGKTLLVRAGEHKATIRMTATRRDRSTRRVHHVNFVGGRLLEEKLDRRRWPAWGSGLIAAVIGGSVVALLVSMRRRLVRRRRRREKKRADRVRKQASVRRRRRKA